ncbi:MAG: fibronectin type III domain-containing protein, partial [Candidatus Hodarchaeales archaeon]
FLGSLIPTIGIEVDQEVKISKIRLSWDDDPQSTVVIMFESSVQDLGKCEYGLTPSLGSQVVEDRSGFLHEIRLSNLSPDSRYYYRVGVENSWSGIVNFQTAPNESDVSAETRFIAWGDSRVETNEERLQRLEIVELSASFDPDFHIMSGDLVTGGAVDSMWDEWFENFEPLVISKVITIFYPESTTIDSTTSDRAGNSFSIWVIISLLALIRLKNKEK